MKTQRVLSHTPLLWVMLAAVQAVAMLGLVACGDDAAQTGVQCAANAPEIVAACPAGTRAVVNAQARDLCEGAASGAYNPIDGGDAGVEGACTASGSCVVLCEFLEPCTCGVATISQDEVVCAACGACGNDVCDPGESTESCPQDCGGRCEIGRERCNGAHREVCNARQQWETLECPGETRCRELEGATTECRAESACTCDEVSACCDGCRARNVGDPCEDDLFCQEGSTCQDDGTCGGGTSRACDEAITAPQCQIASCDEVADRCVALPANEGDLCDNPDTLSQDHCAQGVCLADGCACDTVDDCCDGCQPRNVAESCDDGLFCTTGTTCDAAGACVGAARDCAGELAATACQRVTCDEDADQCVAAIDPDALGTPCEDDVFCTVGTTCQEDGSCGAGQPRDCSDAVSEPQCQGDPVCNEAAQSCGVEPANEGQTCEDGDPRTLNDVCSEGQCVGEPCPCGPLPSACCDGCQPINLGGDCDDGLFCTETTTCQADGACGGGQARACGDADEPQCQSAPVCDEDADRCVSEAANEGMACDDGNPLSADDACIAGVCRGVPPHALLDCDGDTCVFARCQVGWDDADMDCLAGGDCANGCEACLPIGDGSIELPDDGIDNDCDGGAEPTNDEARGFYIDPAFTPAGADDCDGAERGSRACPFTDLYDAVLRAEDEPWGTLDPVRRELYLAQGRYTLDAMVEIYDPLIVIGGYEPTDSGPWINRGSGTEIVRTGDGSALQLSGATGSTLVLDRLTLSPLITASGPPDGDIALVRIHSTEGGELGVNFGYSGGGFRANNVYLHNVELDHYTLLGYGSHIYDSIIEGASTPDRPYVAYINGAQTSNAVRSVLIDRSGGEDYYTGPFIGSFAPLRFVGNRLIGGYTTLNVNDDGMVYGNDLDIEVNAGGSGSAGELGYIEHNRFPRGLFASYGSLSDSAMRLHVAHNTIHYAETTNRGGILAVHVLHNNRIDSEGALIQLRAKSMRHNTVSVEEDSVYTRPLVALGTDDWPHGDTIIVDSNIFVLRSGTAREGFFDVFETIANNDLFHSVRRNAFYADPPVPYLIFNGEPVAESLRGLNRYTAIAECGRDDNIELESLEALRWLSIDPDHPDFATPAADSPLIDAGLVTPETCEGVMLQDATHDVYGNPRACGEGPDIGAIERCP